MRKVTAAMMLVGAAMAASPASGAPVYPWCTTGAGHDFGARNCGFVSFEQCMQTARGNGQNCERNPFYVDPPPPAHTKSRKAGTQPSR